LHSCCFFLSFEKKRVSLEGEKSEGIFENLYHYEKKRKKESSKGFVIVCF